MAYFWVYNVKCEIMDGSAYLSGEDRKVMRCSGKCHTCEAFLGVDITDTGKPYYKSCCAHVQNKGVTGNKDRERTLS
jgi:hypothetical protein